MCWTKGSVPNKSKKLFGKVFCKEQKINEINPRGIIIDPRGDFYDPRVGVNLRCYKTINKSLISNLFIC